MTVRVSAGLRAVEIVASRPDPTEPLLVGAIAQSLAMPLSSVSRLCAELVGVGLLERGAVYGSYRPGPAALELSGLAAAPYARIVRTTLTRIVQETGETAFLAAPGHGGMRVVAAVTSPWTLYSPATVGELVDDAASAVAQASVGFGVRAMTAAGPVAVQSERGKYVEVALPVFEPAGTVVAVVAVRLPANRSRSVPLVRRAVAAARRAIEREITASAGPRRLAESPAPVSSPPVSALEATVVVLRHLARGSATPAELAKWTGLRRDRLARLLDSCRRAGIVRTDGDGAQVRLEWGLHGWVRAAVQPTLVERGASVISRGADETGACGFITVLRGMRSVTIVEELRSQGEGLQMTPWLGRPCPIGSADGGPTLVMGFADRDIALFLPKRADAVDTGEFLARVDVVRRDGVLAKDSFDEVGQIAISAPILDAGGAVVAAVCLVGATDLLKPRTTQLVRAAQRMSAELSTLLGYRSDTR